ncbi:MAG: Na+/H+ antiporter NhaC family protein [Solirubrobacterales bacterium]
MEILFAFIISFILLILCVFRGIFVAYPLGISFLIFVFVAVKRGNGLKKVAVLAFEGSKKSVTILKIFILIGGITAIWMSSGTVAAIVFYGIEFLKPDIFVLSAFLICCFVSFLIGTSFGTIGTVGIALMVIARGGGVSVPVAAGAIIAGAYFGDRCSPMSSSANLVGAITGTNIYENIKNMFKTSIIPFVLAIAIYFVVSLIYPLNNSGNYLNSEIIKVFKINIIVLIPALIMLAFSIFKVDVKLSMLISVLTAVFISIYVQNYSLYQCINYMMFGYNMPVDSPLSSIIKGGGILSMLKTALVVFISSAFSGIFEGTGMLNRIQDILDNAKNRYEVFRNVALTSMATSMFGCSQSLAVIMTEMLNKKSYIKNGIPKEQSAVDLENTAIIISPLIPWNVALLVPMVNLRADFKCIPFIVYLYLIPLFNLAYYKIKAK